MFNFTGSRAALFTAELNAAARCGRPSMVAPLLVLMLLAFVAPQATYTQVLYGSLTGDVTDQKGAAVPGVKVEALNIGTGSGKETTTDGNGGYQFTSLQPGVYNVTFTYGSFKTLIQEKVRVEANALRRLDVQMQVADVKETVVVTQDAAPLQTDRADVNTQLQATQLADLPISTAGAGRNFQGLYRIVPGFSAVTEGVSSDGGNPQRSMTGNVNGNSMQANLTRIDGASNAYIWLPFNTAYIPPTDSIESVSIVTNSYDAEQGNANGAAVNVVTKSGTNEFHGSAFEFHTDNALRAFNRFSPVGQRKPKYILNQFGGSLGGPIYLPKFGEGGPSVWSGKNKLFFFTDLEYTKRRQFATRTVSAINPAGIFDSAGNANLSSAIPAGTNCNVTPVAGCVFDPNTGNANGTGRQAFPGNIIPASRIDAASRLMLSRIRPAGFINNQGVTATNNYISAGSASLGRTTGDVKINYVHSEKLTMFGRYSRSETLLFDPPTLGDAMGGATGGGQVGEAPSTIQSVGLGGTYTVSSTIVIDANFGYTRQRLGAVHQPDIALGNFGLTTLGIPGTNGDDPLAGGTPAFIINGWNGIGNVDTGNPFLFRDNQYVGNINASWTRGAHSIRFGGEYGNAQLNHFQPQGGAFGTPRGSFNFGGAVTALNGGPAASRVNAVAQYLLGIADRSGKVIQNSNPNALRWHTWSAYVRDSWQVNPNLTLNFGARWEHYPFPTTDHGGVKLFNPATGNVLIGGNGSTPIDLGVDVGWGQIVPRFGLAYRWGDKTVIRAGYGMSTDSNNWRFFRNNWPLVSNADLQGASAFVPSSSLHPVTLTPYPGLGVGIPAAVVPNLSSGNVPLPNNTGIGGATIPFDFNRGYTHSYNLTVQRELPWGFVGEAAYVGNRAIRFLTNENINAAPVGGGNPGRPLFVQFGKNWGDVGCLCPDTNSYYDALQAKLNRRLTEGFSMGVAYTFSKAINSIDNEEVSGTFGVNGGFLFWPHPSVKNRNKSLASYDRTHNLSIYGSYELPFGARKRWAQSGILGAIAGGWQLNWLMQTMSGSMFTLFGGGTQVNAPGNQQTPDQIGPLTIVGGVGPRPGQPSCAPADLSCHYFDPSAFRAVPGTEIRFGTTGRNIIRGPGFFNLDSSIFRNFKITEGVTFQFRMEMFGVTNTPHLNNPGTNVTDAANFGVITSTLNLAGRGTGSGGERQVWFGAKVIF
ncbi:MAG: TonB-dependent receptor [Pyrinomonadaceae bacterium]|nr:TonB-dependent receptor [Pyrinomonadaceae bacterium]